MPHHLPKLTLPIFNGDTNTPNTPSPSESSNRYGATHSRARGRNKEHDARSTPRKFSEATGGSGKPEKSTRDSQSNIEMVESCKTLRRDAESKTGAILKASSWSVRLSCVPRTQSKFLADTPKDPTVSLSHTNNGPYASSGDTSQDHRVSLDNIPKPWASSDGILDGPVVSSINTPQTRGTLSGRCQRGLKKLSDY
ncbi:hypothetical protein DPMN_064013 [Dreissena polymorpha]|uniref:Uncharacterized protein n=1 Tax=Dreissena polymorpha TaxID=45954 RepID=A0A9D4HKS7_DREPO|nr:hypothetical protein DPMN_064013 [Dreissena polymorpha]